MYISDFKLVDILREKMGEEEARALVEFIEVKVEDKYHEAKNVFATKEDLLRLEMKILENNHKYALETQKLIADSKADFQKLIADSKTETQKLIADSKAETHKLIADSKFETIKWMFGMFLMATVAIIGTILTVLKMGGW